MLVIRLSRTGRKKQPYYRVVVAEKSAPIKGRFIEVIGHFDPRTKDLKIDTDRAKQRLENGAQPSETAEALLEKAGVLKREAITEQNRRPTRKSKKEMKAEAEEGDKPAAAPAAGGDAKPAEGDAEAEEKSDTSSSAKASDDKKPDKEDSSDEASAKSEPSEPKAEEKKEESKPEAKPEVEADNAKKDDSATNDDKGDSK